MSLPLLLYDAEKAAAVHAVSSALLPELADGDTPLTTLAGCLGSLEALAEYDGEFARLAAWEGIYYLLMEYRSLAPAYFPVHDICLLMANALARAEARAQGGPEAAAPVVLLDWGLLPVAALLAQWLPGGPREFFLPPAPLETGSADRIARCLGERLPNSRWHTAEEGDAALSPARAAGRWQGADPRGGLPRGAVIVAKDPLAHGAADPRFLERLAGIGGGVLLSSWDFLGVRIHAHTRSQWLGAGLLGGIAQLPRPRRQGATGYPAVITLRPADPGVSLRLARVSAIQPGPGSLEQKEVMALLEDAPKPGLSMDLDPAAPARDGLFSLSPATWLTPPLAAPPGRTLRAFAQVLRCQLARERLPGPPAWEELVEVVDGEPVFAWHDGFGETGDGAFVAREVSLGELDAMTGFVDEQRGNVVRVALNPLGKQGKYLLQANDIVFAFRGTAQSVGKVGFAEELGAPAITGQSMCIIRALPDMDPVWLYYYLQREEVLAFIRSRASGASLLTVNLESIRDIPVAFPGRQEIDDINLQHRKISENMLKVAQLHRESRQSLARIHEIGRVMESVREWLRNKPDKPQRIRGRPKAGEE